MSSGILVKWVMRLAQGFCCHGSCSVKACGKAKAAGWRSGGPAEVGKLKALAVEQRPGHLGKVGARKPQQIGITRRRNVHFLQGLLDIYEALDTPDGTDKHRRTPFRLLSNTLKMI